MTVWDKIYKDYQGGGEAYATLRDGLDPEFLAFIKSHEFSLKKVLDVGCGHGKYLAFLKSIGFEVSGIDSSPIAIEMTKARLKDNSPILLADMYEYDFPTSKYDLVISIAAIHHGLKKQVKKAIDGVYSSLVAGGCFFTTLPDNEGSNHWSMMIDHQEIEPGTRVPLSGAEKGLPHSAFTKAEIEEMFVNFKDLKMELLADRGRWIISGMK